MGILLESRVRFQWCVNKEGKEERTPGEQAQCPPRMAERPTALPTNLRYYSESRCTITLESGVTEPQFAVHHAITHVNNTSIWINERPFTGGFIQQCPLTRWHTVHVCASLFALSPVRGDAAFNVTHRIAVIRLRDTNIPDDSIVSDGNVGANLLPFQISICWKRMAISR